MTGGGAGSSLLKDPQQLQQVVAALVAAVGHQVPVSVKMRSGFMDTSLFRENLFAVQEAGAAFVTLHPRTKQQAYSGRADWSLIALAKELLDIPVVSDSCHAQSAQSATSHTHNCVNTSCMSCISSMPVSCPSNAWLVACATATLRHADACCKLFCTSCCRHSCFAQALWKCCDQVIMLKYLSC